MSGPDFLLWLLLAFCSYRVTRLVTSDQWPPTSWFRDEVDKRYGADSSWATLFNCGWCFGWWICLAVYAWAWYLIDIPYPLIQAVAGSFLVGYLGAKEDD